MKSYKPLTKKQVMARVSNWREYCLATAKDYSVRGDNSMASVWYADAITARNDLEYLKRGTNWRDFEGKPYAYGQARPWTFVYPAEISTPMPWELLRRQA